MVGGGCLTHLCATGVSCRVSTHSIGIQEETTILNTQTETRLTAAALPAASPHTLPCADECLIQTTSTH